MVLFLSIRDDRAKDRLAQVKLKNSPSDLSVMTQSLKAGTDAFINWALTTNGQVLESAQEIVLSILAENLPDLKDVKYSYEKLTGNPVSIGIGTTVLDSSKALEVAALQTDCVMFYTEEVDLLLEERKKLQKADGHSKDEKRVLANTVNNPIPELQPGQVEEEPQPLNIEAIQSHLSVDPPKQTALHGKLFGMAKPAQTATPTDPHADVKSQLAAALADLQAQSAAIEELKLLNPQLYQGINELALTVVGLARQIMAEPTAESDGLAKAESGAKSPTQKIADIVGSKLASHNCKNGDCYHATEAMYHLMGGKEAGYVPHVKDSHWFLKNQNTGKSYFGDAPDSRPKKFATEQPSSKAVEIIDEVIRHGPVKKSEGEDLDLAKYYLPKPKKPRSRTYLKLPIGSVNNGSITVLHRDGTRGKKKATKGTVASKTKAAAILGANTQPASPAEPYSTKD